MGKKKNGGFLGGFIVGVIGYGVGSSIGAEGDAIKVGVGTILVIGYAIFSLKSDLAELIGGGILFALGFGFVAYLTGDIYSILLCIYAIVVIIIKALHDSGLI